MQYYSYTYYNYQEHQPQSVADSWSLYSLDWSKLNLSLLQVILWRELGKGCINEMLKYSTTLLYIIIDIKS